MDTKLHKAVIKLTAILDEREKNQDAVLKLSREIIRDCARAIKSLHVQELGEMEKLISEIDRKLEVLRKHDGDFPHISQQCYQEVVEIKALNAIFKRQEIPDYVELNVEFQPWLSGLADVVGELRRALQLSLRASKKEDAEYYFGKMNEIYDNLMVLKYSGSLIGGLKHKQDMMRGQIENARSEMLRAL
ncbi:MAG: hypothetical protein ABH863_01780 [Candidatus Micrarchaeota archaeon]